MDRISIITVCYNCESEIEKTILSVINQTYPNIQYIIIDGGSTDSTLKIINKYRNKISIVLSEKDNGIYDAMNKGIDLSDGIWINFMNAGDTFYNNNVIHDIFENKKYQADIIYGSAIYNYGFGEILKKPSSIQTINKFMGFCHQSTFINTYVMKKYKYNLKYKIVADYDFFLKVYKLGYKFIEIPQIVSIYERSNGISSGKNLKLYKRHMDELVKMGVLRKSKINFIYTKFIIKLLIKKIIPQKILIKIYNLKK